MTVRELIAILASLPPEAEVIFHDEEIAIEDGPTTIAQVNERGVLKRSE